MRDDAPVSWKEINQLKKEIGILKTGISATTQTSNIIIGENKKIMDTLDQQAQKQEVIMEKSNKIMQLLEEEDADPQAKANGSVNPDEVVEIVNTKIFGSGVFKKHAEEFLKNSDLIPKSDQVSSKKPQKKKSTKLKKFMYFTVLVAIATISLKIYNDFYRTYTIAIPAKIQVIKTGKNARYMSFKKRTIVKDVKKILSNNIYYYEFKHRDMTMRVPAKSIKEVK